MSEQRDELDVYQYMNKLTTNNNTWGSDKMKTEICKYAYICIERHMALYHHDLGDMYYVKCHSDNKNMLCKKRIEGGLKHE